MKRVLILLVLAACSNHKDDPGPTCTQLVDHMLPVMQAGMAGHPGIEVGNRTLMIQQCEDRHMPKDQRACIMKAARLEDLAKCRDPNDPGPRQLRRPAPPPAPVAPPPAPAQVPAGSGSTGSG